MCNLTNRVPLGGFNMDRFDDTIDKIVAMEWDMFQAVNEGGPRASCQEDRATFEGMRRGQFEAWSEEALEAYADDLLLSEFEDRNLIREKYINMMKNVAPAQYAKLVDTMPLPNETVFELSLEISTKLMAQTERLFAKYPYVTGSGRPLRSVSDYSGVTSIETYQLGELLTYSETTLRALKSHLEALESGGRMLARDILENSVRHYGYQNLEAAEAAAKARIDGISTQFSSESGENTGDTI
jgi:hypothetical protein